MLLSVPHLLRFFYSFDGRIGRRQYWVGLGVLLLVGAATIWTYFGVVGWQLPGLTPNSVAFAAVFACLAVIPGISLAVKRLHDRGKSGFWLLLFWLIPICIESLRAITLSEGFLSFILEGLSTCVSLWGQIEMGLLSGEDLENEYGQPID